jgi:hypothetical protein
MIFFIPENVNHGGQVKKTPWLITVASVVALTVTVSCPPWLIVLSFLPPWPSMGGAHHARYG